MKNYECRLLFDQNCEINSFFGKIKFFFPSKGISLDRVKRIQRNALKLRVAKKETGGKKKWFQ